MIGELIRNVRGEHNGKAGHGLKGEKHDILFALGNERRIGVIKVLDGIDSPEIELSELSHKITKKLYPELDRKSQRYSSKRKSVYVSLKSTHIETLDNINAIDYDGRFSVKSNENTEKVARIIEQI